MILVANVSGTGPDGRPYSPDDPFPAAYVEAHREWADDFVKSAGGRWEPEAAAPEAPKDDVVTVHDSSAKLVRRTGLDA